MVFPYDLSSADGLRAFCEAVGTPDGVSIHPFQDGADITPDAFVLSSYMLLEVGLRFPLSVDLCYLLNGLRLSLGCYRPNVLRLLMGVSFVNERLNVLLGDREVLANYHFAISNGEPYFQIAPTGKPLVFGIEDFDNRNWKRYPLIVVSGRIFPEGEALDVRQFDPSEARARHKVVRSMAVNSEAVERAFKAQLDFKGLLSPEGRRRMTVEEIADIDTGGVGVSTASGEAGPSVIRRRSHRLAETRFRRHSAALASQGVISVSESSDSAAMDVRRGKRAHDSVPVEDRGEPSGSNVDLAQVVFDLRRQSAVQGEELKRMRSDYYGLVSDIGDLESQVARLEGIVDGLEEVIRGLQNAP